MKVVKFYLVICFSLLTSFSSCAGGKTNAGIEIGKFDSIPSTIDGGCCVFYTTPNHVQNRGYVMVNDLANTAYMMINHHLERFTLVSDKNNLFWYRNDKFNLKVIITSTQSKSDSESYKVRGTLIVEDHKKNRQEVTFYGDCSW